MTTTNTLDGLRFRFAQESDIPGIVALLKSGLGEKAVPKSVAFWRWKHYDNPFGRSLIMIALAGDVIVGVRAFMRWNWRNGNENLESVRGVDTVIAPEFQGLGLFGKLTSELFECSRLEGVHFLFSTPNRKSASGYKRLGWGDGSTFPIHIRIINPGAVLYNLLRSRQIGETVAISREKLSNYIGNPALDGLIAANAALHSNKFITAHTRESVRWRYSDVPVGNYSACGIESGGNLRGLAVYRIKSTSAGRELRVTDVFIDEPGVMMNLREEIETVIKHNNIDYVTCSSFNCGIIRGGFSLKRFIGPRFILKRITLQDSGALTEFSQWNPSLGDIELF